MTCVPVADWDAVTLRSGWPYAAPSSSWDKLCTVSNLPGLPMRGVALPKRHRPFVYCFGWGLHGLWLGYRLIFFPFC